MKNAIVFLIVLSTAQSVAQQTFIPLNENSVFLREEDKLALKNIFSSKRIVGLGEATHGTHEFFTTKTKLVQFLVQECGYRVFAMETYFSANLLNDYMDGKQNDLGKVLGNIYPIYHTQEVVELIKWFKHYNRSVTPAQRVKFYGIDSEHMGNLFAPLTAYIGHVDPLYVRECAEKLQILQEVLARGRRKEYLKNIEEVHQRLRDRKREYVLLSSVQQWQWADKVLEVMKSAVEQSTVVNKNSTAANTNRDEAMANNVKWILTYEGDSSKMIVWAHNGHIQKVKYNLKQEDHVRMGERLHEFYGDAYYAIGFDFGEGSFNAVDYTTDSRMQPCYVFNENTKTFTAIFQPSTNDFMIDFNTLERAGFQQSLANVQSIRQCGIGFSGDQFTFVALDVRKAFDGLLFIKTITPSVFVDGRTVK